jgi:hypothetical protein
MDRRALLAGIGGAIAASTAGCTGGPPTAAGSDGDDGGDETTTAGGPQLVGKSLTAELPACTDSEAPDRASVSREGTTVTVEGTIGGSDGCQTAALAAATYDAGADELRVDVKTEKRKSGACVQCLVEIDYVADFSFEGGLPGSVVVSHEGEVVTEA